jgi:hypothetical protein
VRTRILSLALAIAALPALTARPDPAGSVTGGFTSTPTPTSPKGTRAAVDLPPELHIRNTRGNDLAPNKFGVPTNPRREPGKGSGLCVFTSLEVAARWQGVHELDGFQEWMTRHAGGGWPEKVDEMVKQFCKEKGRAVPGYVQHTGGDP